jgi:hypothetical protein
MNGRIKELYVKTLSEECSNPALVDIEKFAELIVRECVGLALDEKQRYRNISHRDMLECAVAMDNYQLLLKEHFGVEL